MYFILQYKFDRIEDKVGLELALDNFECAFKSEQLAKSRRRRPLPNQTANQWWLIVIQADKTGAPVIMDREEHIKEAFQQHLGNKDNYKQITEK